MSLGRRRRLRTGRLQGSVQDRRDFSLLVSRRGNRIEAIAAFFRRFGYGDPDAFIRARVLSYYLTHKCLFKELLKSHSSAWCSLSLNLLETIK